MTDVQVGSQVLSIWNIISMVILSVFLLNLSNCQQRYRFKDSVWTLQWRDDFALLTPFQLWANVTTKFVDIENFTDCDCPRVYYPACGTNEVTYVNPCIIRCCNRTMKRLGPCLLFRRVNEKAITEIRIPKIWKANNTRRQKVKNKTDSEDKGFYAII